MQTRIVLQRTNTDNFHFESFYLSESDNIEDAKTEVQLALTNCNLQNYVKLVEVYPSSRKPQDLAFMATFFNVEEKINAIFLGYSYAYGRSVALLWNCYNNYFDISSELDSDKQIAHYSGAASFGKWTISHPLHKNLLWAQVVPAYDLKDIADRLNLYDTSITNNKWGIFSFSGASGLHWKLQTEFVPKVLSDGNMQFPPFLEYYTDLLEEPTPCRLVFRMVRDKNADENDSAQKVSTIPIYPKPVIIRDFIDFYVYAHAL